MLNALDLKTSYRLFNAAVVCAFWQRKLEQYCSTFYKSVATCKVLATARPVVGNFRESVSIFPMTSFFHPY